MRLFRIRKLLVLVAAFLTFTVQVPVTVSANTPSDELSVGEYYRPKPPEVSGRVGTTAAYRRSPCPAINALANHGYIARDGKDVSAQALKEAVMRHFNVDNRYADTLVALAKKPVFNLDELSLHNNVEHDMSLVHIDAFFGDDPASVDADLVADTFGHVGASGIMDSWFFARTQQRRLRECIDHNPQCEFSNEYLLSVTLGRHGLLMRVMGGKNEEAVDIQVAKTFLINETFPQPWVRSSKPVSQNDIQDTRIRLFALLKASGEWLGDGFGSTVQQLISDSNSKFCLDVSAEAVVGVATCDPASELQQFQLDDMQRLTTAKGVCIQAVNASVASGSQLTAVECSQEVKSTQQWRYDASGRLRPFQAPDLCIDLVEIQADSTDSSAKVVMAACSTRTEQRFYALYANFQPSVSQIASMYAREFCLGVDASATTSSALDLSPIVMNTCDEFSEAQQLTLDESKRLMFQYDNTQCVDLSEDSADAVVQKPCSGSTTTWHYDSLGRLHPGSDFMKCLSFPSNRDKDNKVRLSDCTDDLMQKWFVSTTKNADIRPRDQYYRPNVFESSGKPGTAAAYSRSPCPALNTLANHGLLPRSGRNLTAEQVKQAVVDHFNIEPAYAQVLVGLAKKTFFNLDELSIHNSAEHDMSLVHADAFFGQDPAVTDTTLIADLMGHVGAAGHLDTIFFARTQARRLKSCQARNPQCDFSNEFLMGVALGRLGLLMRGFGGDNKNLASVDNVRAFLVDERFPTGFKKSLTPITQADIQETRTRVFSLLQSSREWLVDGFASSTRSVVVVSEGGDHALCFEIAKGSSDANAPLTVAVCDASKSEQKIFLDDKQRLVVEKSKMCLATLDHGAAEGSPIVQLECSDDATNQVWTYDASGRLRPAHASMMCLEVGSTESSRVESGSKVTLQSCSDLKKQRFYSFFDSFQANGSHLTSIENPQLCIGVVDGSTLESARVQVSTCDPLLIEQRVTLDAKRRLVFQHSNKCITRASGNQDKALIQAACGEDTSQQWRYDSLGRLHSVSNASLCATVDGSSSITTPTSLPLVLKDCSDSALQLWYASDANDPNSRPQNAYYRPDRDESSGKLRNSATYSRSPCPALNALANHGIISRDGRNISRADLIGAAVVTFNIEQALAERLMGSVADDYINLDQFSDPAVFSYQGSMLHNDQFFDPDPAAVDPDFVNDLFAHVSRADTVDLVYLAAAERHRVDARARDTGSSTVNIKLSEVKYMVPGLVLRLMSGKNEEIASADAVKMLLVEERIPEGYVKPSAAMTVTDALGSASKVQALIETGGASSSGPGGSSEAWLSKPFHPQKEQIFMTASDGSGVRCLQLTNAAFILATCDATKTSQQFSYDEQQRLVVEDTASCLDVIDGKLDDGAQVSHTDCVDWPHQKWTYDSSGRLHPQHGPKFCLEAGAGSKAVINKCSERDDQVFFAAFSKLSLYDKQLISAGFARTPSSSTGQLTQCISGSTSGGNGGISTDLCNAASPSQLFTLNDAFHLVGMDSKRCLGPADTATLPAAGSTVSFADCVVPAPANDLQSWSYDSLGRLQLTNSMGLCLSVSDGKVSLQACSVGASQQWIVATLTAFPSGSSSGGGATESASAAVAIWNAFLAVSILITSVVMVL